MNFTQEKEEDSIELGGENEAEETTSPRLKAAPRGSLSSVPKKERDKSAPYDQASGLRAARASADKRKKRKKGK